MSEIVSGVYLPPVASAVVRGGDNSVSYEIPHLRIPIFEILLHSKDRFPWVVNTVLHFLEFRQGFVDRSRTVCTGCPYGMRLTASVCIDFLPWRLIIMSEFKR